jgi:hypothetical protein
MKYIVVTGGIASGLGKGITASSIAVLLQGCGWKVTMIKIDPYLNVDAGTMSPFEHGETFVLDDGGETDLDLGRNVYCEPEVQILILDDLRQLRKILKYFAHKGQQHYHWKVISSYN